MGHNVQSQAGVSLSDVYDVKGGQAPIERILTQEVPVVHEMGATIQSERFSSTIRRRVSGDIVQSTAFDEIIDDLPGGVSRILGVSVFADVAARSDRVAVLLRDPIAGREIPIWIWNATTGIFQNVRFIDAGGAVGSLPFLYPVEPNPSIPSILVSSDQPQRVPDIAFRGQTTAFGAGTVEHTLLIHIAFAAIGGISSRGLPVPSW